MLRKKHIIDEKSDFYQLIMLGMIEIILVVILIQLIFSLNNYSSKSEENYIQMTEASAERIRSDIESVIKNVNNVAFSVSYDGEMNDMMYGLTNIADKHGVTKKLSRYAVAEYINSVHIYNADKDELTGSIKRGGTYVGRALDEVVVASVKEMPPDERRNFVYIPINMIELSQTEKIENYIAMVYFPVSGSASSIIITVGCDHIADIVTRSGEVFKEGLIITDSNDKVIYGQNMFAQSVGDEWEKIEEGIRIKNGNLEMKIVSKSVNFTFMAKKNADVVGDVFAVVKGNRISILGMLIAIGVGLLLSFFVLKRVVSPIKILQTNYMMNKNRLRQMDKKRIVQSLIMVKDKTEMETMLRRHNDIIFDIGDTVVIVMVTIDNFDDMREKSNLNEFDASTYSVENVFAEIASEFGKSIEVLNETRSVLLISNVTEDNMDGFVKRLRQGTEILKNELDISVSVAIGSRYNIYEIYYAYNKIKQTAQKRYLRGYGSIIFEEETSEINDTGESFGINLLRDTLIKREYEQVGKMLEEMFERLKKSDSVSFAKIKLVELFMAFADAASIMHLSEEDIDFIQSTFYDDINSRETLEEAWQGLQMLMEYISTESTGRSNKQDTVNAVLEIVENEFSNSALCVDDISGRLNLSTFYLNKIFKNDIKTTIPAYILQYRLGKACELLENTNLTVKEILFKTGFVNASYFGVVFKKHYGITPANYRKLYSKK